MNDQGLLFVISGFSGAGKGTVVKELLKKYDNCALSISATTRAARHNEEHGREYFFVNQDEFDDMIEQDKFIEYARYVGRSYGTPKDYVLQCISEGKDVILEIEMQGALEVKGKFQNAVMIFIVPPSAKELKSRLIQRGTEAINVIDNRIQQAVVESDVIDRYDYIVINDNLDECVMRVANIIDCQHNLTIHNTEWIKEIKKELIEITKKS
jgi:guanylate kinase